MIALEDIGVVDARQDRTNQTVRKIQNAVILSNMRRKGNFCLRINDGGSCAFEVIS